MKFPLFLSIWAAALLAPAAAVAAPLPELTARMDADKLLVVNVSGRGDKDIFTVAEALGVEL